jgi:hypothetical protein
MMQWSRGRSLSALAAQSLGISKRLMTTSSGSQNKGKLPVIIHPYSQSLPSRGYEWCSRCGIRSHEFEKRLGEQHACLDLPRRIPLLRSGICGGAKSYYRQQMNYMFLMTAAIFGLLPVLGVNCDEINE